MFEIEETLIPEVPSASVEPSNLICNSPEANSKPLLEAKSTSRPEPSDLAFKPLPAREPESIDTLNSSSVPWLVEKSPRVLIPEPPVKVIVASSTPISPSEPDKSVEPPKSNLPCAIAAELLISAFTITPLPIAAVPFEAIVTSPLTSENT